MPRLLRNPIVRCLLHNNLLLVLIQSQIAPIHSSPSNSFKINFNIIPLPLTSTVLLSGLLLSDIPTKFLLYSSMYATCPFRRIISHKRKLSI
jgi:hypothetical protein